MNGKHKCMMIIAFLLLTLGLTANSYADDDKEECQFMSIEEYVEFCGIELDGTETIRLVSEPTQRYADTMALLPSANKDSIVVERTCSDNLLERSVILTYENNGNSMERVSIYSQPLNNFSFTKANVAFTITATYYRVNGTNITVRPVSLVAYCVSLSGSPYVQSCQIIFMAKGFLYNSDGTVMIAKSVPGFPADEIGNTYFGMMINPAPMVLNQTYSVSNPMTSEYSISTDGLGAGLTVTVSGTVINASGVSVPISDYTGWIW